ncbi:type III pantothenate kinase [Rubrivirga sp.]|uniref:type III pantothenate kinase n=1 Tax=Rubrivirga sp. TaxID=1885344 RepID=UPI003C7413FB
MPFLALDVGNSSVKGAVWNGGWGALERWTLADLETWTTRLRGVSGLEAIGLASVVPSQTGRLVEAAEHVGVTVSIVSSGCPLPFRMDYETPDTLGADRLAAAVAAHALAGDRAVVALDAGTAITTEVVTAEPAYLGGAILPGPDLLLRSLARGTGQLPQGTWPDIVEPFGSSTIEAIQAGTATLVLEGVTGLVDRTLEVLGHDAFIIATGGWGTWLADRISRIDRVEPLLVLEGVRLLTDPTL